MILVSTCCATLRPSSRKQSAFKFFTNQYFVAADLKTNDFVQMKHIFITDSFEHIWGFQKSFCSMKWFLINISFLYIRNKEDLIRRRAKKQEKCKGDVASK